MGVGTVRDNWYDARDTELRAFFDRPFHPIKFEDGECEGQVRCCSNGLFLPEGKFDTLVGNRSDRPTANRATGGNVELLANFGAQDTREMDSMVADDHRSVSICFIGDPATTSHDSVLRCRFSVLSFVHA